MEDLAPLTAEQRRALAGLNDAGLLADVYLAGGVGVAWHLHHRRSIDLDLFSRGPDLDLDAFKRTASAIKGVATIDQSDVALTLRLGRVPIDIVRYKYPLLGRLGRGPEDVAVASLRDLAVMKVAAIARRGIRRDFWDLHAIALDGHSLRKTLDDYRRKFGVSETDVYHVIRALTWFDDAEQDRVLPTGLTIKHWTTIRAWFEEHAAKELRRRGALR